MSDYLIHHGIQGQKWGIRRYQNEDGSLTTAGRKRYGVDLKNEELTGKKTARYASRFLNDSEEAIRAESVKEAENIRKANQYGKKAEKVYRKAQNKPAEKRTEAERLKYNELVTKQHKYLDMAVENRKTIKKGEQFCFDAVAKLQSDGRFDVSVKIDPYRSTRYMSAGKRFVTNWLMSSQQGLGVKYNVKFAPKPPKEVVNSNGEVVNKI